MQTLLNEFYQCHLLAIVYEQGSLSILIAEAFRAEEPSDVEILGMTIKGSYAVEPSEKSRVVQVLFPEPVIWQVSLEDRRSPNVYDVHDAQDPLRVYAQSRYLDFARQQAWFVEDDPAKGGPRHYGVFTEFEIIDVVASAAPTVRLYSGPYVPPAG